MGAAILKTADKFDALLKIMATVPVSAVEGTQAEAYPASDAESDADCSETQIPTDISEGDGSKR